MKVILSKTLMLKGAKTASAPKVGEPVTAPLSISSDDIDLSKLKVKVEKR
ncbi:MAG: hypothetical protein AAFY35_18510 [Pseudomonadota bacterium]